MQLSTTFIANIQSEYKEQGQAWLNTLPEKIVRLSKKWNIEFIEAEKNLSYNFIGLVKMLATGEVAIMKVSLSEKDLAKECHWLRLFSSDIVPTVYQYDELESAMLMEKLEPGHALASIVAEDDEAATRILCQSIRSLQASTHPTHLFKHLSSFEKNLLILQGHVPERILSKSIALFHDLNSDRSHDVVLHGDLHHYNILASGNAWKVIDPHAYVGDPTSEVGPMIFNPLHHFPTNHNLTKLIKTRIHMLIDELPYDPQRIKAWTFCRCILASAWTFESRGVIPEMIIAIAAILEQL